MDVLERIKQLRDERRWSNYKLSQVSGVSQTTLRNMFARNTLPGISTLEAICEGFGMTLSQFFADGGEPVPLNDEQRDMLKAWGTLTEEQKSLFMQLMKKL
jgi:transcriptional regulator with XRE-family HTH domain